MSFTPNSSALPRRQRGASAVLLLFLIAAGLAVAAFNSDATRVTGDAAQVKRATDAAALAVGNERVSSSKIEKEKLLALARKYVLANLGMDKALASGIGENDISLAISESANKRERYEVAVSFPAKPSLLGGTTQTVSVHSTAEILSRPTEIALVLPNKDPLSLLGGSSEISALARIGKYFAKELLKDGGDEGNVWLSVVPYSQAVNVYDPEDAGRITRWTKPGGLRPTQLPHDYRALWKSGYSSLADKRIPDRATNRLCMYRGLLLGQNYFYEEAPAGQFGIYYRAGSIVPGQADDADPSKDISWVGPNPVFGGADDTRYMVADGGCPAAPLLPLTSDLEKIDARLDAMKPGYLGNYAIAMGWAAMALSPGMRGSDGWGNSDLPLDFNADGSGANSKIIVMLGNLVGDWFDVDFYNFFDDQSELANDNDNTAAREITRKRFISLCNSFQSRNIEFHFIGLPGSAADPQRASFESRMRPGLSICAANGGSIDFAGGSSFTGAEEEIKQLLDKVIEGVVRNRYVRLVE